ncbi:hypothetical protein GCM10010517_35920 [Streptosporangium fragile]|uniref:Peptidase C51 domain-containing protein n=1 Tax=Streptosporangium fragile TaxID=46186 RepID=A0ABN3VXR8_9ACTN
MDPIGDDLLSTIRTELGYREGPGQRSKFGEWYAATKVRDPQYETAPWCDMFLAWAAEKAGAEEYVGQFAWTPSHARWFETHDAWSRTPEPGALVFFDWSGGKDIGGIDHVGVVERVEDGTIHTIEGNVDRVWLKRKKRDESKVVGYGLPRKVKEKLAGAATGEDHTSPVAARIELRPAPAPGSVAPAGHPGTLPVSPEAAVVAGLLVLVLGTSFALGRLRSRVPAGRHRRGPERRQEPGGPPVERARPVRYGRAVTAGPAGAGPRADRPDWAREPYRTDRPARPRVETAPPAGERAPAAGAYGSRDGRRDGDLRQAA